MGVELGIQEPRRLIMLIILMAPPDPLKIHVQRKVQGLINKTHRPRQVQRLLGSIVTCAPGANTRVCVCVCDVMREDRQTRAPERVAKSKHACVQQTVVTWEGVSEPIGYIL